MILLWKSIPHFKRVGGEIPSPYHPLQRPWNYLWCCYVRAPMPPISKRKGCSAPSCTPFRRPCWDKSVSNHKKDQKGALWATTNFKVTIIIRSPSHQFYKHFEISIIGMNFYNTFATRHNTLARQSAQNTTNFPLG